MKSTNSEKWPNWKKTAILVIVSFYSFLGNASLLGPSVYITIYSEEFGISPSTASGLVSYPNLAFGFGNNVKDTKKTMFRTDIGRVPHPRSALSQDRTSARYLVINGVCASTLKREALPC